MTARAIEITKAYGRGPNAVIALDRVTVGLPPGRFTAVMGPSGSASPRSCTAWPDWTLWTVGRSGWATLARAGLSLDGVSRYEPRAAGRGNGSPAPVTARCRVEGPRR